MKDLLNCRIGNIININKKCKFLKKVKINGSVFWVLRNGRVKVVLPIKAYKKLVGGTVGV